MAGNYLRHCKVITLGKQSVGKTSLLNKLMYGSFNDGLPSTVGVDFLTKTLNFGNGQDVRLQFWDTAGQERFNAMIPNYVRDSSAAIVVYDVTNKDTFNHALACIESLLKEHTNRIVIVLVGNKADLVTSRQVLFEDGQEKARELGVLFYETSAKSGVNVKDLFEKLATGLRPVAEKAGGTDLNSGDQTTIIIGDNISEFEQQRQSSRCPDIYCGKKCW